MRYRLAQGRLRESEALDPEQARTVDLILTKGQLERSLRDVMELLREAWPHESAWSERP